VIAIHPILHYLPKDSSCSCNRFNLRHYP